MNINGNSYITTNSLSGKSNINCKSLNGVTNNEIITLKGIDTSTTIQQQLNSISGIISNSINGGGFFMLYAETPSLSTIVNSGYNWEFGSASNSNKGVVIGCDCYINHIGITASGYPTNNATIKIMKSTDNATYSDTGLSITLSTSQTYNTNTNLNYQITKGTILNFQTTAGSGSVISRISVTFSSIGVKGDTGSTPTFTVGSVNSLPYGSTPSVSITGTQTNPILNFNLITGPENAELNGNTQGITYDLATDTTTIDNNFMVKKTVKNRGDGISIYADANIATTGDVYMNCYSVGGVDYGYYKAIDFINARDQVCYDRGTEGVDKANAAQSTADAATAVASTALAATVTNAAATALVATNVATLDATVAGHTTTLETLGNNVSALNGKTSLMSTASSTASNFNKMIKVYTTEDPISAVITIDPYEASLFSNGLQVGQVLTANEISCDVVGCNTLNLAGNLSIPDSEISCKNITTSSSSVQNIYGSAIHIGSFSTPVYINGLLYDPITNFLNQWE